MAAATRAGAALVTARVTNIEIERRGFRLDTADGQVERAAWVIGADGANSLVRRRLARPFRRDQLSIATGFFARGISSDEVVLELVGNPPGYIWSFPRPDHLAIGICTAADAAAAAGALRARVAEWIRITGIAPDAPLDPYSWPIPSLSPGDFETLDVAGQGWLLVGDAAGLVDPITREGIVLPHPGGFAAERCCLAAHAGRVLRSRATRCADLARAAGIKADSSAALYPSALGALSQTPGSRRHGRPHRRTQSYRSLEVAAGESSSPDSCGDDDGEA